MRTALIRKGKDLMLQCQAANVNHADVGEDDEEEKCDDGYH
jgi:hypothetical protein